MENTMIDKQPAEASIGNVTGWLHGNRPSTAAEIDH
jgi:hypothetical protein